MNLLNVAYYLPKLASVLGGQIAREEEWDFLKNGSYGVFSSEKVQEFGTAVLNLMCTIGIIICLLLLSPLSRTEKNKLACRDMN